MEGMFPPASPPGSSLTQQVLDDGARLGAARQCLYATLHLPLRLPYRQSQFSSLLLLPIKLTFPVLLSEVNGNHRCFRVRRSLDIIQVTSPLPQVNGAPDIPPRPADTALVTPSQRAHSTGTLLAVCWVQGAWSLE